jgi:hypothetical protein
MLTAATGVAVDSSRAGPMFGGSIGWTLTPRLALEGSGLWIDHEARGDAFAAALKVQVSLLGPHKAVPFLNAGIGMYRASLDLSQGTMPAFYGLRIRSDAGGYGAIRVFTDPSFTLGGGANVFLSRTIAIRPDVETMIVLRNSRSHVVTAVKIAVVVHIEEHPVTPVRAGR